MPIYKIKYNIGIHRITKSWQSREIIEMFSDYFESIYVKDDVEGDYFDEIYAN